MSVCVQNIFPRVDFQRFFIDKSSTPNRCHLGTWPNQTPLTILTHHSVSIAEECLTAFSTLRSRRGTSKPIFIIYKITDDRSTVVVEESSSEQDYEVFLQKLYSAGGPRYAVYDVEFDLREDGKRCRTVFISWVPNDTPVKVCFHSCSLWFLLRETNNV